MPSPKDPASFEIAGVGCQNLTAPLRNIEHGDSGRRVIAVIDAMAKLMDDDFPNEDIRETTAKLIIRD